MSTAEAIELVAELERWGVDRPAAALAIATAFERGPDWYADQLAADGRAWSRFEASFNTLCGFGGDAVHGDAVTIGSLAWTYVLGDGFTARVADRLAA